MCFLPQWKQNAVSSAHSAVHPLSPRAPWPVFLHAQSDPTKDGAPSPNTCGLRALAYRHIEVAVHSVLIQLYSQRSLPVCVAPPPTAGALT